MMERKKTAMLTARTGLDIRFFVQRYVDDMPSKDFNALVNQIAFLDLYKSIQLEKASMHILNDIFSKAVQHFNPATLYSNSFSFDDRHFVVELFDFSSQFIYRSQLTYPDMEIQVNLKSFQDKEEAENFLVEKLSNQYILEKLK